MSASKLFPRLAAIIALVLMASTLPLSSAQAQSPLTKEYCENVVSCRIWIKGPVVEGNPAQGRADAKPNTELRLQVFQIDRIQQRTVLVPVGAEFTVLTNAEGRVIFDTPALPVKTSASSHLYTVGAVDLTPDVQVVPRLQGNFTLLSAHAHYVVTNVNSNGGYFTHLSGAAAGEYRLQVERQGRWDTLDAVINDPAVTEGSISFEWRLADVDELQSLRIVNITADVVIFQGGIARYKVGGGWGDVDNSDVASRLYQADIVAVDGNGDMRVYFNRGSGRLSEGFPAGGDWSGTTWMAKAHWSLLTRSSDGSLWSATSQTGVFQGGAFTQGDQIGRGWGQMDQLAVVPQDRGQWSLLARTPDGRLLRYGLAYPRGTHYPEFQYLSQVGTGWDGMAKILSTGDLSGDGIPDILAIGKNGNLYRYTLNSAGRVVAVHHIGRNWQSMVDAFSPGDMDGDSIHDLVARRNDGRLFLYKNFGNGNFGYPQPIGSGWNGMKLLA